MTANEFVERQDNAVTPQTFSPKACRKQAALLLKNDGHLSLIWAILAIIGVVACGAFALVFAQDAVLSLMSYLELAELWTGLFVWLSDMLILAAVFFLLLPVATGMVPFALSVTDGHPDASLLFMAFADENAYGHALALLWSFLWRVAAAAAVTLAILGGLTALFPTEADLPGWAVLLFCIIGVVILLLTVMLSGGTFLLPYLAAAYPQKTVREYRVMARAAASGHHVEIFYFRLFFIVTACLSLFTVGITLVVCVLPLYLTAYVYAARTLLSADLKS